MATNVSVFFELLEGRRRGVGEDKSGSSQTRLGNRTRWLEWGSASLET